MSKMVSEDAGHVLPVSRETTDHFGGRGSSAFSLNVSEQLQSEAYGLEAESGGGGGGGGGITTLETHGDRLLPVRVLTRNLTDLRRRSGSPSSTGLGTGETRAVRAIVKQAARPYVVSGVDFSRAQMPALKEGRPPIVETWGPYAWHYAGNNGLVTAENILPDGRIGLQLARRVQTLIPNAEFRSLVDDYTGPSSLRGDVHSLGDQTARSVQQLFEDEGIPVRVVRESELVEQVPELISQLGDNVRPDKSGSGLLFFPRDPENPALNPVPLTQGPRVFCQTADTVLTLADSERHQLTFLAGSPDIRDQMWEIARSTQPRSSATNALRRMVDPRTVHDVFFDPKDPRVISTIEHELESALT